MPSRVSSELLLVGSLPASSSEEALRAGGELFGDMVFALPDGETGPRMMWTAYDYASVLEPHPDVAVVEQGSRPPRHLDEIDVVRIREGVDELRFESWPRIDDAIASYDIFRTLRSEGVIPEDVRFQVSLPLIESMVAAFKPH